jgi:hypothetical protein
MKLFLLEALIAAFAVLCILAVKYRSRRARETLLMLRNAAWIYIAAIVVLAVIQVAVQ